MELSFCATGVQVDGIPDSRACSCTIFIVEILQLSNQADSCTHALQQMCCILHCKRCFLFEPICKAGAARNKDCVYGNVALLRVNTCCLISKEQPKGLQLRCVQ